MMLMALEVAMTANPIRDWRNFYLAAIGVRKDGVIVKSQNGAIYAGCLKRFVRLGNSHAECRVLRKMDWGGVIYVARVLKQDFSIGMASPCEMCRIKIKSKGISKVYYTINEHQYGVWDVVNDRDTVYTLKGSKFFKMFDQKRAERVGVKKLKQKKNDKFVKKHIMKDYEDEKLLNSEDFDLFDVKYNESE